jgi:hypothetical protein
MHDTMDTLRLPTLVAPLLVTLVLAGCGGGGGSNGGSGNPPPSPPQEPTANSRTTAVRVSGPTPFAATCLAVPAGATVYANAEVEPHLDLDRTNPNHLVAAWQQDRLSDGGARGLATATSVDGGATWSAPQPSVVSQCGGGPFARVSDPWVAVHGPTAFLASIAFTGAALTSGARSAVTVTRSIDGGVSWGLPVLLVDDDGTRLFHDKESLTIDSTDARYVYATWDRIDLDDNGPTLLARSVDGGANWLPAVTIYDPGAGRQTIGNVAVTTPDGTVHVFFTELGPAPGNPALTEAHLAVIRSIDKGATWSAPSRIAELRTVGTRVPNPAQSVVRAGEVLATFAADPRDGTLYAAWQDARFSGGAHDAIALAWSTDGGGTWTAPIPVNSDPDAAAFTPTLAVLPNGTVGVLYFDFRADGTSTYQPTELWLAVSNDRVSWREARLAWDFDFLDAPFANGLFVADYQGLDGDGTTFTALYARTHNGVADNRTDVFFDRVDSVTLAATAAPASMRTASTTPAWTAAGREAVSRHLSSLRAARQAQWRAWREAEGPRE